MSAPIDYLFTRRYSWEMASLFAVIELVDKTLADEDISTEHLIARLEEYRSGEKTLPDQNPHWVNKILDAVVASLSHEDEVIPALIEKLSEYRYLAITMLGWFGPKAQEAIPALLVIAKGTSEHVGVAMKALRRIA